MKKVETWNNDINKHIDWGGDTSTNNLPVSGEKVQKFIKDSLQSKIGYIYEDIDNSKCYAFADYEDYQLWIKNGDNTLLISSWTCYQEQVPTLTYSEDFPEDTILRFDVGERIYFNCNFTSSARGQCTIVVLENGATAKTFKSNIGLINIDLGIAQAEGTKNYTITAYDAFSIGAQNTLSFKVVIGGIHIVSDFQELIDSGLNTDSVLTFRYDASSADDAEIISVKATLKNSAGENIFSKKVDGDNNILNNQTLIIPNILDEDTYTFSLEASAGGASKTLNYTFILLNPGNFKISSDITNISSNTNSSITVPFRIYSGDQNIQLQAHGEVYNSQGDSTGITLNRIVYGNTQQYWALGKIQSAGNYTIKLWATTLGSSEYSTTYDIPTTIEYYEIKYSPISDGLIAEFIAEGHSNKNDSDTLGIWKSTNNSKYYFELVDLNYNTNGWKHVNTSISDEESDGEMMLSFTGESYGILKEMQGNTPTSSDIVASPIKDCNYNSSQIGKGFTAEFIFKTKCIGELNNTIISASDINGIQPLFQASYNKLLAATKELILTSEISEDEWIHTTIVFDKNLDRNAHTNVSNIEDYAPKPLMTIYINGVACNAAVIENSSVNDDGIILLNSSINPSSGKVDYFGSGEIKLIRFYSRPLWASEVYNNYRASIYSEEERDIVIGRNSDVLPIIKLVNINDEIQNTIVKKSDEQLVSFSTLSQMTQKQYQKKQYTATRFIYKAPGEEEDIFDYSITYTQGTSSLAFPIKNFKFKFFTDNTFTKKLKVKFFDEAVGNFKGWVEESTFTAKNDYMEAAHLNNTPTCSFYNDIIDSLIESGDIKTGETSEGYDNSLDQRSPSRRQGNLDAIKGFPCLIYYYESEQDYARDNGVYVGSFMFNLDKSSDSLGFKAPAKLDSNGEIIKIENPRTGELVSNICQSFEGVANSSDSAGCFYSYEDWKISYYTKYLQSAYQTYSNENDDILSYEDFISYYSENSVEKYSNNGTSIQDGMYDEGYLLSQDIYINLASPYKDEYDYLSSDYESRYDWDDLEEGREEFWGNENWGLKRMIDWVSSASKTSGTENDIFRSEFNQYFNLLYCIIYYLQMILFGQVDNAGKNSMWDSWDGLIWMPRPYDLDTQAGLDNTGFEVINPDAELIETLSPTRVYNATSGVAGYSQDNNKANVDENGSPIRYKSYNTRTSKFWIAFATSFKSEIESLYAILRNRGIYDLDYIMTYFKSKTSDVIGESYYNKDMATKFYKLADIDTYITRMHGNRIQKFKSWMRDRIIFCDTLFNYKDSSKSLNNNIIFRSDALGAGVSTISVGVGIRVYSPQYVMIDVGSGKDAIIEAYCSPTSTYIDPITQVQKDGVLFTIPLAGGDKEIQISGSGNIMEITNIQELKVKSIDLQNASKLINLDVSYSTKLQSLSLLYNSYLRTLNCNGSIQLQGNINLTNCINLKQVNLNNTNITSVDFPVGGSLKTIYVRNSTIPRVYLDSLQFLIDIDLNGCENISEFYVNNCNKIEVINASSLMQLRSLSIENCKLLNTLTSKNNNNIEILRIFNCPNLQFISFEGNRSSGLELLDLQSVYKISELDLSGSGVKKVIFPSIGENSDNWKSQLISLNLNGADLLESIQYGSGNIDYIELGPLQNLKIIEFTGCTSIKKIKNLNYSGNCTSLFRGCKDLISIEGTLSCSGSASQMCYGCINLQQLPENLDFSKCTSLYRAFWSANIIGIEELERLFITCSELLKDISQFFGNIADNNSYFNIGTNFFSKCTGLKNVNTAFYSNRRLQNVNLGNSLPKVTEAKGFFYACTNLKTFLGNNAFENVEDISGMFYGCTSLTSAMSAVFFNSHPKIKKMFRTFYNCVNFNRAIPASYLDNLTELEDARQTFALCKKVTGSIPEGVFEKNVALSDISECFRGTGISEIKGRLFGENNSITKMGGLFAETSITAIPEDVFLYGNKITHAGNISYSSNSDSGVTINAFTTLGCFENCTNLVEIDAKLFDPLKKVQNFNSMFKGCTKLNNIKNLDLLFSTNSEITSTTYMFSNTSLSVGQLPEIFKNSPKIVNTSYMFFNAKNISDFNLNIFKNLKKLTNVSNMFGNSVENTGLMTVLPDDSSIFEGCTSLQDTSYMFYNCKNISGEIFRGLFDDCRNTLQNTSHMFQNCLNITNIQTGDEDYDQEKLGLLANCINLTTTESMFAATYATREENKLGSSEEGIPIPWDIFWSNKGTFNKLTNINNMFGYSRFSKPYKLNNVEYMFDPRLLENLPNVITMRYLFACVPVKAQIHPSSFISQKLIEDISYIFYRSGIIGAIPNNLFNIDRLTTASRAFVGTAITEIGETFLRKDANTPNNVLEFVNSMFYGCSYIESNLPPCNNPNIFRKIGSGENNYWGYAHGCTNAMNYNDFGTGNWTSTTYLI